METIEIELYIPATCSSFDCIIPYKQKIADLIPDIVAQLQQVEKRAMFDLRDHMPVLCDQTNHRVLCSDLTLQDEGVLNGSLLLLC